MSVDTDPPEPARDDSSRFRTGDCLICLDTREITRGGARVEVESKVLDLIALLLHQRTRVLSKRELGDALWPERAVSDAALSQLLRKARRALGDDGGNQRFIRTVHGHGLQWIAQVLPEPSSPQPGPDRTAGAEAASAAARFAPRLSWRWGIAVGVGLLAIALTWWWLAAVGTGPADAKRHPVVVVLPTLDRSGEPELAWTQRGLAGLMVNLLQGEAGIEATPAPDVALAAEPAGGLDEERLGALAESTGASHVVASELRRLGSLYEFEFELRGLRDGMHYREVLRGRSPAELAAGAAARLQSHWRPSAATAGQVAVAGITDPFVAELYARGLDAQLRGDQRTAIKYFEICLDRDPDLPWPRLQLAIAQGAAGDSESAGENAQRVADVARDGGHAMLHVEALRQLGSLAFRRGDLDAAERAIDAAMGELPVDGQGKVRIDLLVAAASVESQRSQRKESRRTFERALELARAIGDRRREASVLVNLAVVDNAEGDIAAALERLRDGLDAARIAGDGALELATLLNLGGAEFNAGHPLVAAELLKQSLRLARQRGDRQVQVFSAVTLSWVLTAFDQVEDAARLAEAVLALGEQEHNVYWQAEAHWALAGIAGQRKQWPQALDALDRAQALYAELGLRQNIGQVLADRVRMALRSRDLAQARAAVEAYRAEIASEPDNTELTSRLPVIEAQWRFLQGDPPGAMRALSAFVASRGADRGPATLAAVLELGHWQIALGAADTLLAEPAYAAWLDQLPEAIGLRIEALRAAGRTAEADLEQDRLDGLRRSDALALDSDLMRLP